MNPELFEENDCEDICGGVEDDAYDAFADEACCGDDIPSTSAGARTEQSAHLPSLLLDGINAVSDGVTSSLGALQDGARQLQQLGQRMMEEAVPGSMTPQESHGPKPNKLENTPKLPGGEVDGVLRKIKEYKLNLMEQKERSGDSSEDIIRKTKQGSNPDKDLRNHDKELSTPDKDLRTPDKQLDGSGTSRTDAKKEAQRMMIEALRAVGVLSRPATDNVPIPGATSPVVPSENAPPKPETRPSQQPSESIPVPGATSPRPSESPAKPRS